MIALRPATGADDEYCWTLHKRTMQAYVVATFGPWDDDLQHRFHEAWFDPATVQIIEYDGERVGVLDVIDRGDELYIRRIEIAPHRQSSGIGTAILTRLLGGDRSVELHVFRANPRARALYERLGFTAVEDQGDRTRMRHAGSP